MLVRSEIERLRAAKEFARAPFAWPGGYPKAAITADGAALCSECVKSEWRQVAAESFDNLNCGFRVSGIEINWENSELFCDHCGEKIPAAYEESNE